VFATSATNTLLNVKVWPLQPVLNFDFIAWSGDLVKIFTRKNFYGIFCIYCNFVALTILNSTVIITGGQAFQSEVSYRGWISVGI